MDFERQRAAVQQFIDQHAACGDVLPSAWHRDEAHVTITQRCACGAGQTTTFATSLQVEFADGSRLPVVVAPDMAHVWRLHVAELEPAALTN